MPIGEALVELFIIWCEKQKSKMNFDISKTNVEIAKLVEPEEEEETVSRVIGFVTDSHTEEIEEDEDDI